MNKGIKKMYCPCCKKMRYFRPDGGEISIEQSIALEVVARTHDKRALAQRMILDWEREVDALMEKLNREFPDIKTEAMRAELHSVFDWFKGSPSNSPIPGKPPFPQSPSLPPIADKE